MAEVYLITNTINGKRYVGFTSYSTQGRWVGHKSKARNGATTPLHCAIRKYGYTAFKVVPLETNLTNEEGLDAEIFYIKFLCTFVEDGKGYNVTKGGEGSLGILQTEDHKRKVQEGRRKFLQEQDETYFKKLSDRMRKIWAEMPEDDYLRFCKTISESRKHHFSVISENDRRSWKKAISDSTKKAMRSFSEEKREEMTLNASIARRNRTEEEKTRISEQCRKNTKAYHENLSEERRRLRGQSISRGMSKALSREVEIDGKVYSSVKEASAAIGLAVVTVNRKLRDPRFPNFKVVKK